MKPALNCVGVAILLLLAITLGGCSRGKPLPTPLDQSPVSGQLRHFIAEKEKQAAAAAKANGQELLPETKILFAAANKGDWQTISNVFNDLCRDATQFSGGRPKYPRLHGTEWENVKEIWGAFNYLASDLAMDNYSVKLGQDIVGSIPPGSIYFGGGDPGRWTVTALQASHVNGDPFFTLSQNCLTDGTYLDYARSMYGTKIYIPTTNDSQRCFSDYMEDARQRLLHDRNFPNLPKQVKPGEDVSLDPTGHVQVTSHLSVMAINGMLSKIIFDHETNREFYVVESVPLDWMYPHLEPHGLIMKINRDPLAELPEEIIRKDHEFWAARVAPVIGDWLEDDTSVQEICAFAQKVYVKHDFTGFKGDPRFVSDDWAQWMSQLRGSIAGIYMWRLGISGSGGMVPPEYLAKTDADRHRMIREADFAYRQAFVLNPGSFVAEIRYVNFLVNQKRTADAIAVAEVGIACHKNQGNDNPSSNLLNTLKNIRNQETNGLPAR